MDTFKLEKLFESMDVDGDGQVTKKEWEDALKEFGDDLRATFGHTVDDIEKVFAKFDTDGDGALSWEEFSAAAPIRSVPDFPTLRYSDFWTIRSVHEFPNLRNKKFSQLGFNPRFKDETFKQVEPHIPDKPILEATAKKAVQAATKDDAEFDKKKHIARAWGNNYSKYFDTVWV